MNNKNYFWLLVMGYLLIAIHMLTVVSLAGAEDAGLVMLPVDAKLGQYISGNGQQEIADVDAKLANFIQEPVDYADPDELLAYRWQAMANYYAVNDMLNFSYAQAEEHHAARWQAMAEYYAANDMLNFSYAQAAEHHAARWQAMAEYYESHGLLNESAVVEEPVDDVSIMQGPG